MAYSDKVLDHYRNPRNVGSFSADEENIGTGLVGAPECGDVMKLQLKIRDDGVIEDAKFKTFGCGSAIASSSYATELVKGKTVDEAFAISNKQIVTELSLPPVKIHCSVLAEEAIKAAVGGLAEAEDREGRCGKGGSAGRGLIPGIICARGTADHERPPRPVARTNWRRSPSARDARCERT